MIVRALSIQSSLCEIIHTTLEKKKPNKLIKILACNELLLKISFRKTHLFVEEICYRTKILILFFRKIRAKFLDFFLFFFSILANFIISVKRLAIPTTFSSSLWKLATFIKIHFDTFFFQYYIKINSNIIGLSEISFDCN